MDQLRERTPRYLTALWQFRARIQIQDSRAAFRMTRPNGPARQQSGPCEIRDMLIISRDRVQKMKSAGKSAGKLSRKKPFTGLDPVWGNGTPNSGSKSSI